MEQKKNTGFNMLAYVIPAAAGIAAFDMLPIEAELLKWIVSAIVTIVAFVIVAMFMPSE